MEISKRWLQIILTLFYGQVISTSLFEYLIQGVCGLILHLRPLYDSILLIVIGLLMLVFVYFGMLAVWYCRTRMSIICLLVLILLFILTLVRSTFEFLAMGLTPIRTEWLVIRILELILRIFGIIVSLLFTICLRQKFDPEN